MQQAVLTKTFDGKFLTAVSIVVGTSVGAGMLGLPVETARSGFFPSIFLFFLTWLITIVTGFLFAEVLLSRSRGKKPDNRDQPGQKKEENRWGGSSRS